MTPRAFTAAAFLAPAAVWGIGALIFAWMHAHRRCPVEGCRERCGHWRAP